MAFNFVPGSMPGIFRTVVFLGLSYLCYSFMYRYGYRVYVDFVLGQVKKHRRIADFSLWSERTLECRLKVRAKANSRLVTAFHLNNSFTTDDVHVHQGFLRKAKNAIRLTCTDDWIQLGVVTRTSLDLCLKHFDDGLPYIALASLVRVVSFTVALHVLFKIDPSEINLDEARKATEAINRLWIQSKDHQSILSLYDQRVLNNALERLLPKEFPCDDRSHPLNLIMPAYETLWRVVLLTFVEVAGRNVNPRTEKELHDAVENVPQCFNRRNDSEMRALAIAKEGLRLYPPTKRIYREYAVGCLVAANVELWQRHPYIWSNPLNFNPMRFHNWHQESAADIPGKDSPKRLSYFPFGIGRHTCPAAAEFGEKIVTLLVVEFARRFGTKQTGLKLHIGSIAFQQHRPLPTGRSDMESWVLELGEKGGIDTTVRLKTS
ncbi:hypothetical protein F5Y09DRAFT_338202 [Xylaria sp. FL1042]|nr:hypothetical protein F5Y09DRAFT_338202 [Xylaria sp. FL1042]